MHGTTKGALHMAAPETGFVSDALIDPRIVYPDETPDLGIRYIHETHPKGAETIEIAPGILWARIPLPFRLNHVNVWLIRETDGWTVIDTGTSDDAARDVWDVLLAGPLSGAPIIRLVATHGHTDHVGLAGWLSDRFDTPPYLITLTEWLAAQMRVEEARTPLGRSALKFLERHGCDADTIHSFGEDRRRTLAYMGSMPESITRLRNGGSVRFGGRNWEVMVCGGHAAAHASFWCAEERILIAGDQVLSKISPMIGVNWTEPEANPLAEYLASLDRFRALPGDPLVLPSHGLPFLGLQARVEELSHHHHLRLETLETLMTTSSTAMELARGLFPKPVAEGQGRHAVAETLAHAHYLVEAGRARRSTNGKGRLEFTREG